MRHPIQNWILERAEIFHVLRDAKWVIGISAIVSIALFLPDQTRELYRIFIADITFVSPSIHDALVIVLRTARFILPIITIGVVLWFGTYQVTTESFNRIESPSILVKDFVRGLPAICGAAPLVACALGQLGARPHASKVEVLSELPAGPWDDFGQNLSRTLGCGLSITSIVLFALAAILLFVGWRVGERLRPWSDRLNNRYFRRGWFFGITVTLIIGVTLSIYLASVAIPQAIGVLGLVAIYVVCLVAACVHFTLLTIKQNFPFIPVALAAAALIAVLDLNDNHDVRELSTLDRAMPTFDDRRAAGEQFKAWYESRASKIANYEEYPVYVVAAEGGGIYAAYQTAIFLSRLSDYCPAFSDHLFAISSVSGGSIGAAAYAAALKAEEKNDSKALGNVTAVTADPCPKITEYLLGKKPIPRDLEAPLPMEIELRKTFANDFLSPLVAGALFTDFTQSFVPYPINSFDRARFLEFAFEKSGANYLAKDFRALWAPDGSAPALFINATDAGSGRRVLVSPFPISTSMNPDLGSVARYQELGRGNDGETQQQPPAIRLSTAAAISARFPWVTPAATIPVRDLRLGTDDKLRLVDGGYIDNSGVETALDLIDAIQPTINEINAKATSDPSPTIGATEISYKKVRLNLIVLSGGGYPVRSSFALGEELEPFRAVLSTRASRAYVAIDRAVQRFGFYPINDAEGQQTGVQIRDLTRSLLNSRYYPLPLGWQMSNWTRQIIEKQSGYFWSCDPDTSFSQSEKSLSEADCIQLLVYHELNQSLQSAAKDVAAINRLRVQTTPGNSNGTRLPHKDVIECYRDGAVPSMTLPQSQSLSALLDIWDAHPNWKNDHLLAFVLGTIANETGDFRVRTENLAFPTAERIRSLWPSRFPTVEDAEPFVNNPEQLTEKVYGDRFGNIQPGDAWRYRGRGMAMIEGRYEYYRYGHELGVDLLGTPELVLDPVVGARVAFNAYFPDGVLNKLDSTLKADTADWNGAVQDLIRVVNKEGIVQKSQLFYGCVELARARSSSLP